MNTPEPQLSPEERLRQELLKIKMAQDVSLVDKRIRLRELSTVVQAAQQQTLQTQGLLRRIAYEAMAEQAPEWKEFDERATTAMESYKRLVEIEVKIEDLLRELVWEDGAQEVRSEDKPLTSTTTRPNTPEATNTEAEAIAKLQDAFEQLETKSQ